MKIVFGDKTIDLTSRSLLSQRSSFGFNQSGLHNWIRKEGELKQISAYLSGSARPCV